MKFPEWRMGSMALAHQEESDRLSDLPRQTGSQEENLGMLSAPEKERRRAGPSCGRLPGWLCRVRPGGPGGFVPRAAGTQYHQLGGLKAAHICSLTVLDTRSLESGC